MNEIDHIWNDMRSATKVYLFVPFSPGLCSRPSALPPYEQDFVFVSTDDNLVLFSVQGPDYCSFVEEEKEEKERKSDMIQGRVLREGEAKKVIVKKSGRKRVRMEML